MFSFPFLPRFWFQLLVFIGAVATAVGYIFFQQTPNIYFGWVGLILTELIFLSVVWSSGKFSKKYPLTLIVNLVILLLVCSRLLVLAIWPRWIYSCWIPDVFNGSLLFIWLGLLACYFGISKGTRLGKKVPKTIAFSQKSYSFWFICLFFFVCLGINGIEYIVVGFRGFVMSGEGRSFFSRYLVRFFDINLALIMVTVSYFFHHKKTSLTKGVFGSVLLLYGGFIVSIGGRSGIFELVVLMVSLYILIRPERIFRISLVTLLGGILICLAAPLVFNLATGLRYQMTLVYDEDRAETGQAAILPSVTPYWSSFSSPQKKSLYPELYVTGDTRRINPRDLEEVCELSLPGYFRFLGIKKNRPSARLQILRPCVEPGVVLKDFLRETLKAVSHRLSLVEQTIHPLYFNFLRMRDVSDLVNVKTTILSTLNRLIPGKPFGSIMFTEFAYGFLYTDTGNVISSDGKTTKYSGFEWGMFGISYQLFGWLGGLFFIYLFSALLAFGVAYFSALGSFWGNTAALSMIYATHLWVRNLGLDNFFDRFGHQAILFFIYMVAFKKVEDWLKNSSTQPLVPSAA